MKVSDASENGNRKNQVCPFLGLEDDSATALSYPSSHNFCFHKRKAVPVKSEYQRKYCLTINHVGCEEYNRKTNTFFPISPRINRLLGVRKIIGKARIWIILIFIVIVILITLLVVIGGLSVFGLPGNPMAQSIPVSLTGVLQQTPTDLPVQIQNTPSPTLLVMASPLLPIETFAPTIVSPHVLETPIGVEHQLVIHRAQAGESLMSIASRYWTTVDAIQAVNYYLPSPLRIDWLIIVPINQTDVQGMPVFEAYQVKTAISVRTLALQLPVDPAVLELYNGFGNSEFLSPGDWVLVPHMSTATP
jgi:hypothetical protein